MHSFTIQLKDAETFLSNVAIIFRLSYFLFSDLSWHPEVVAGRERSWVAFILSDVDKWHQCEDLVFAYDNLRSTVCSIKMMKYLYVFNLFYMFSISEYHFLLETVFHNACFLLPSSRKLLIRLHWLLLIMLISFRAKCRYHKCSNYLLSHKMLKTSCQ